MFSISHRAEVSNNAFRSSAHPIALLGIQGVPEDEVVYIRNIALVLSATVTVLTGFDTFSNHRTLWVRYTQTVTHLLGLQARLDYLTAAAGEVSDGEVERLFEEMERILAETNRRWQDQRSEGALGVQFSGLIDRPD